MSQNQSNTPDPTTPTQITLIRHGHVHNPQRIIYGRMPGFRLSQAGRRQAEAVAAFLRQTPLAALFSSPEQRALETAEIIRRYHPELEIIVSPLIDEVKCYFEGHPAEELEARDWDLYSGIEGDYEMPPDIAARGMQFLHAVRAAYAGQHVAAVTHGDLIAFTVLQAMGETPQVSNKHTLDRFGIIHGYPETASLTTLSYRTTDINEIPQIQYIRPYEEELVR